MRKTIILSLINSRTEINFLYFRILIFFKKTYDWKYFFLFKYKTMRIESIKKIRKGDNIMGQVSIRKLKNPGLEVTILHKIAIENLSMTSWKWLSLSRTKLETTYKKLTQNIPFPDVSTMKEKHNIEVVSLFKRDNLLMYLLWVIIPPNYKSEITAQNNPKKPFTIDMHKKKEEAFHRFICWRETEGSLMILRVGKRILMYKLIVYGHWLHLNFKEANFS